MTSIGDIKVNINLAQEAVDQIEQLGQMEIVTLPFHDYQQRYDTLKGLYSQAVEDLIASKIGTLIAEGEIIDDDDEYNSQTFVRPTYIVVEFGSEWNDGDGSNTTIGYVGLLDEEKNQLDTCFGIRFKKANWKGEIQEYEVELGEEIREILYSYNLDELCEHLPAYLKIIYPQV